MSSYRETLIPLSKFPTSTLATGKRVRLFKHLEVMWVV